VYFGSSSSHEPRPILLDGLQWSLADNPPQLGRHPVQHRALLLHALAVIVDLAGDGRHDLLRLLARGMVEAFRDPRVVETEITGQRRRRPA